MASRGTRGADARKGRSREASGGSGAQSEMGAGIAASPHCAERRICRCSVYLGSRSGKPVSDPASRSWLTSSGVAFHRTAPSCEEPDRSTRLRGPKVRWSFDLSGLASQTEVLEAKTIRCSAALLGSIPPAFRFAHQTPKTSGNRVALEKIDSSGASSRLAPKQNPKALLIACRRRSDLWSPAASACRCRLLERPGPPSRSPMHHALRLQVGEAKNVGSTLWITGISGTISGTFCHSRNRPAFGCRSVPLPLIQPSA